jgi:MoxR-like ATPase
LIKVSYPTRDDEREILARTTGTPQGEIQPVLSGEELQQAQALARRVPVPDHVTDFVLDLVRATRTTEPNASAYVKQMVGWGAGPRASQHIVLASKVRALLRGRTHVTIDDVEALAYPIMRHRIVPTFHAEAEGVTVDYIVKHLLESTRRPQAARVM